MCASVQEYVTLCEKLKEISTLSGISGLLGYVHLVNCFAAAARTDLIVILKVMSSLQMGRDGDDAQWRSSLQGSAEGGHGGHLI